MVMEKMDETFNKLRIFLGFFAILNEKWRCYHAELSKDYLGR